MRTVPWWTVVSAVGAPVALIGGWTLAAARQPADYSSVRDTISALAGYGAHDRWLMGAALVVLGGCHLVTSAGLRPAAPAGRALLAAGGVATLLVAAFPLPRTGASVPHTIAASLAFGLLAVWPAVAWRTGPDVPWALRRSTSFTASAVLLGLVGWFTLALAGGSAIGLSERVAAGAQSLWPLLVVLSALRNAAEPQVR